MTPLQLALLPFTLPYGAWMRLRAAAYRRGIVQPKRLKAKVISVGNLTTGGTGKTPMVLYLAERLLAQGRHPAILTRGYLGKSQRDGGPGSTSDEVRLLRSRLGDRMPIGVGADRFVRGRELERKGVDCFILDDGFQHLRLARDVNILLVDATNPFGGGHLLPAGRLREPRSALARADVIIITRSRDAYAPAVETVLRRYTNAPIFYSRSILESVTHWADDRIETGEIGPSGRLFAFCAIGNAQAFFDDLRSWNFQVVGQHAFADHHRYTQPEADRLMRQALGAGADALLCTEKDFYNLDRVKFDGIEVLYIRMTLQIEREDDFWRTVQEVMARNSRVRQ